MKSSSAVAPSRTASILSPVVDFLCVGGLSLILLLPLLLSGRGDLVIIGAGAQAWIATVVNMPHFMASYRLVYRSRETILRHNWASIYIPAILLVYIVVAVWDAQTSPVLVVILVSVSSAYLAWHYTGQVWGMMASYAYLDGQTFENDRAPPDSDRAPNPAGLARDVVPGHAAARSIARSPGVPDRERGHARRVRARGDRPGARCGGGPGKLAAGAGARGLGRRSSSGTQRWRGIRRRSSGSRSPTRSSISRFRSASSSTGRARHSARSRRVWRLHMALYGAALLA